MRTKPLGALAAVTASLAVVLCGLSVVLPLPSPIEIALVVAAVLPLATAGGLLGAAVAAQRKSAA
ncbi:hypothetical protein ABZ477_14345 [Microbacterium sp. NPDC019599]|uniref:hypothetical protein n=1 Tax=Microbacterium sp. NPDC019599 TaxID=3154690 RepID=UPI0033D02998